MTGMEAILLADLRYLLEQLGEDGGLTSPAIYDTAQVVRLAPPATGVWPALEWLLAQQQPDGGWGSPGVPRARDLPTLAALLALHARGTRREARDAVRQALSFLRRQANVWAGPLPDDLTAGVELLLPRLREEAEAKGLDVSLQPYRALITLGAKRREAIARLRPGIGTTPLHSWEAWGEAADPDLIDRYGSIGHSPAATAFWLHLAADRPELAERRAAAEGYLERAANATGMAIPGVMPTCWPTPRFEQVFALQALYLGGVLHHPALAEPVSKRMDEVERALGPAGIGFSDVFAPDGDDTAAAIALLHAWGRPVTTGALRQFANDDHFCAWRRELQPSLSVTAHAIHTLQLAGEDTLSYERFMIERQLPDGRWPGDKWNGSWLYTTWRVLVALQETPRATSVRRGLTAILANQRSDGGWGDSGSNMEETAYAVLALRSQARNSDRYDGLSEALNRGDQWLRHHYRPFAPNTVACWLAKEPYRPQRIARAIELVALLSSVDQASSSHVKL
jgi:hypothetical protein